MANDYMTENQGDQIITLLKSVLKTTGNEWRLACRQITI